jgi:hypothetical protein
MYNVHMIKTLLSLLVLISLFSFGCKGKEEVQPAGESPLAEQQEQAGTALQPGFQDTESFETSPGFTGNTPPKITSLKVSPEVPVAGDTLRAEVKTYDQEGDNVTVTYQWSRNDDLLIEDSDTLELTNDFKRGDKITLKATPNDGILSGASITLVITIANAQPVIIPSQDTFRFDGSIYTYRVKASDADGDPLTYTLKSSPAGMIIDSSTGEIKWNVPPGFAGKAPITVSVSDGSGGEVLQSFTLEIRPE